MDNPKRILVIQLKRAGDVIVTTPVLSALRQAMPEAQVDFLVDKPFAPLLEMNPDLHQVHIYDRKNPWKTWRLLRQASYDWILDFQSSPRSIIAGLFSGARLRAGYRVSFWGRFFSHSIKRPGSKLSVTEGKMSLVRSLLPTVPPTSDRRIYLTAAEREWAVKWMGEGSAKGVIGLIPTHRRDSRRWPAPSFTQLARLLVSEGYTVLLFWGPGEQDYVQAIQSQVPDCRLIPPTSLRQMAALLELCKMVVTNDNGPMHTAVAVGTPTLTIYGPTDPISWNPGGPHHRVIQASHVPCLGCNLNACPFGHECMTEVTPEHMVAQIRQMMNVPAGVER